MAPRNALATMKKMVGRSYNLWLDSVDSRTEDDDYGYEENFWTVEAVATAKSVDALANTVPWIEDCAGVNLKWCPSWSDRVDGPGTMTVTVVHGGLKPESFALPTQAAEFKKHMKKLTAAELTEARKDAAES